MKRPEFTQEQEDWLIYAINVWYQASKYKFERTPFGIRKELLKDILCGYKMSPEEMALIHFMEGEGETEDA